MGILGWFPLCTFTYLASYDLEPNHQIVMLFDVTLLIMRDADLYDDLAIYVKRSAGRLGELVLRIGELMAGPDMSSVSSDGRSGAKLKEKMAQWSKPPTKDEEAQVKRELTENW